MDVDQDPSERTALSGTPFDDDYTTYPHRGAPSVDPSAGVQTKNCFTSLSTESQETGHTTVNTGNQTPKRTSDHMNPINETEEEELAAAKAAEVEALRNAEIEAEVAAAAAEAEASASVSAA